MSLVTLCAARSAKLPESSKFVVAPLGNWHDSAMRAGDERPHDASGWRVVGWPVGWWIGRPAAGRGDDNSPGASWFVHPDPESASASGPQLSWPTRVLPFR